MQLAEEYTHDVEGRFRYVSIIVSVLIVLVVGRVYYLQVIRGSFYRFFSTENSIKELKLPAPRGMIVDRRGQVIADNRPAFDLVVIPQYVADPPKAMASLQHLLHLSREELDAVWEKRILQPEYEPLVVKADISLDEVALLRSHKDPWYDDQEPLDLRGVEVHMRYERLYPFGASTTHLLGYVREIDADRLEVERTRYPGRYELRDRVGIEGLEERHDLELRGFDGFVQRVVNAVGREVDYAGIADELKARDPVPGTNMRLTIDRDLQVLAHELFAGRSGAAVVIDVQSGAVRVFYSSPSYDLNRLMSAEGSNYWMSLASDPKKPLINRALEGMYPPGSTFKMVTGIAALAHGKVKPNELVGCHGALVFGGRPYHCWREGGHGGITFHRSLVESCDVFYYTMGLRVGIDEIARFARLLGLGTLSGIPLADEKTGLIPTSEWKQKRFGVPWQEGETLSVAVGQGYVLVTPLQNALMMARVANGGVPITPYLIESKLDGAGREIFHADTAAAQEPLAELSPEVLDAVRKALVGVVAEPSGTAHRLSQHKVTMGGKTGTAQVVSLEKSLACSEEWCRDHGWFVGFAPAEKPEIAAAVIVEHGGFGASSAAPIVGELLQKYYDIEHPKM